MTIVYYQAAQVLETLTRGLRKIWEFVYLVFFAEIHCPASGSIHVHVGGGVIWFDPWTLPPDIPNPLPGGRSVSDHDLPQGSTTEGGEIASGRI